MAEECTFYEEYGSYGEWTCECECSSYSCGCESEFPVRYATGAPRLVEENGLSAAPFGQKWGHTLSYGTPPAGRVAAEWPNGYRMFVKELPSVEQTENGDVAVIQIVNDPVWFNKIGDDFVPRFFSKCTLSEIDQEFVFTDARGQILTFFNFDPAIPEPKRGQFKSLIDPAGNVWTPTYDTNHRAQISF